ncbi:hypothetical protein IMSAGC022_00341 [Alistipes sp.]|nr:hypothetical protein IMSAGC022_00341 [Alistipes sp.]
MFRPVFQVSGSSHRQAGKIAVPGCIKHDVQSVFRHCHTRVFATTFPFYFFKIVFGRTQYRCVRPAHHHSVRTFRIANTGRSLSNTLRRIVFRTVEYHNLPVFDGCRWIESVTLFPSDRLLAHRALESSRLRRNHRIHPFRTDKRTEYPLAALFFDSYGCLFLPGASS